MTQRGVRHDGGGHRTTSGTATWWANRLPTPQILPGVKRLEWGADRQCQSDPLPVQTRVSWNDGVDRWHERFGGHKGHEHAYPAVRLTTLRSHHPRGFAPEIRTRVAQIARSPDPHVSHATACLSRARLEWRGPGKKLCFTRASRIVFRMPSGRSTPTMTTPPCHASSSRRVDRDVA